MSTITETFDVKYLPLIDEMIKYLKDSKLTEISFELENGWTFLLTTKKLDGGDDEW